MPKFVIKTLKATIIYVIVALLITALIILGTKLFFGAKIEETISLVSKVAIDLEQKNVQETTINEDNKIKNYPEYGTQYATIET